VENGHSQKIIMKKALAAVSLPRRTTGNLILFDIGNHLIALSDGRKEK